jgi:hypothetical protein
MILNGLRRLGCALLGHRWYADGFPTERALAQTGPATN